jgi:TPP-dependent indolepyruvate ferredoxin oxidoreductase alpha subunit
MKNRGKTLKHDEQERKKQEKMMKKSEKKQWNIMKNREQQWKMEEQWIIGVWKQGDWMSSISKFCTDWSLAIIVGIYWPDNVFCRVLSKFGSGSWDTY